tara:strand:- start:17039 stop:18082 length:1044 start_codon:yes stop_codon:yes gene_type:complete
MMRAAQVKGSPARIVHVEATPSPAPLTRFDETAPRNVVVWNAQPSSASALTPLHQCEIFDVKGGRVAKVLPKACLDGRLATVPMYNDRHHLGMAIEPSLLLDCAGADSVHGVVVDDFYKLPTMPASNLQAWFSQYKAKRVVVTRAGLAQIAETAFSNASTHEDHLTLVRTEMDALKAVHLSSESPHAISTALFDTNAELLRAQMRTKTLCFPNCDVYNFCELENDSVFARDRVTIGYSACLFVVVPRSAGVDLSWCDQKAVELPTLVPSEGKRQRLQLSCELLCCMTREEILRVMTVSSSCFFELLDSPCVLGAAAVLRAQHILFGSPASNAPSTTPGFSRLASTTV